MWHWDKEVIDPIVNPQDEIINSMQIPEDEVGIIKDTVEPPVIENPIEEAIEDDCDTVCIRYNFRYGNRIVDPFYSFHFSIYSSSKRNCLRYYW